MAIPKTKINPDKIIVSPKLITTAVIRRVDNLFIFLCYKVFGDSPLFTDILMEIDVEVPGLYFPAVAPHPCGQHRYAQTLKTKLPDRWD
jgi:hypothetical protein